MPLTTPPVIVEPFAVNGLRNTVPVGSLIPTIPGRASYNDGFPPLTMTPLASGGVPPFGRDMNGVLYDLSAQAVWAQAGRLNAYSSVFSTANGGYPEGAVLASATDPLVRFYSTASGNTHDPDSVLTGWLKYAAAERYVFDVRAYGAKGDDATNDTAAIQAALNAAAAVYAANGTICRVLFPPGRYRYAGLTVTDAGMWLYGPGATLVRTANAVGFSAIMTFSAIQNISALSTQTIDLTGGIGPGNTSVTRLTVSNANAYAVGDWVKVLSDDATTSSDDNEREGEFARVASVNGGSNFLYLTNVLEFSTRYTTAPRVTRMNSAPQVTIEGLTFDYLAGPSYSTEEILLRGAYRPNLINVTIKRNVYRGLTLNSTLRAWTLNYAVLESEQTGQGYGIVESSSELSTHITPRATKCRHLFTTGVAATAAGSLSVWDFGRCKYHQVHGGEVWNNWKEGFDTHPDGYRISFFNCLVRNAYIGPNGGRVNYNIEGIGNRLVNCGSIGGTGYIFNATQAGLTDACKDNVAIGCWHEFNAVDTQSEVAFETRGVDTQSYGQAFINCQVFVRGSSGLPFLASDYNNMTVINPTVWWESGTGTQTCFKVNLNTSMTVEGGQLYTRGAAGNLRLGLLNDDGSTLTISGLSVTGGVALDRIANLGASNSNLFIHGCFTDVAPSANFSGTTTGTVWFDLYLNRSRKGLPISDTQTIASGAITARSPNTLVDTEGAAATDDLDTINGGEEGITLSLRSVSSSRDTTVKNGTGNLTLGSDFTLSNTADLIQFVKRGSTWFKQFSADNA